MANITTYLQNKILDHSTGRNPWLTPPAQTYAALFTSSPTIAGGGTEVTGTGYSRQAITWGAASNGTIANSADITWTAGGEWSSGVTINSIGIYDASTSGNLLWFGPSSAHIIMENGDMFKILAGSLTLTIV